jgi:hypothetical protein
MIEAGKRAFGDTELVGDDYIGRALTAAYTAMSTAQEPALDDDAVLPVNVTWFSQELREIFRKHFVAWGDSTDWEKIARKALDSLSLRAAIRRFQAKAPETGEG